MIKLLGTHEVVHVAVVTGNIWVTDFANSTYSAMRIT